MRKLAIIGISGHDSKIDDFVHDSGSVHVAEC